MAKEREQRKPRLDAIDLENLDGMTSMGIYKIVKDRISSVRTQKLAELVQPHSEIETATLRGFIEGLDTALRVPEILRREAEGRKI